MRETPSPARRAAAVGVGLFVLWQLAYLPAANLIDFVPRRMGDHDLNPAIDPFQEAGAFTDFEPLQRAAERVGDAIDCWSELSGQDQGWKLFSPGTPSHSLFPAVEFRFADGTTEQVRSRFEPADLTHPPMRPPVVNDRYYNYESQFTTPGWYSCRESLDLYPEMWSKELPKTVRDNHRHIIAWLKWQTALYRAAHPERGSPVEVVLMYRFIPTPKPHGPPGWTGPITERPYARWLPGGPAEAGMLPVEGFDPIANEYVRFPVEGTR